MGLYFRKYHKKEQEYFIDCPLSKRKYAGFELKIVYRMVRDAAIAKPFGLHH